MLLLAHPTCSTCRKARAWLDERGAAYELRDIVEHRPTESELRDWHERSGLPLRRFFNTSGMRYRELELASKLPGMSEDEQFALLASDGMLVKRPLLVADRGVVPGFRVAAWLDALG